MTDEESQRSRRDPGPDPSPRTVDALLREIANLKEIVYSRLDAQQSAAFSFKDDLQRVPTAVQEAKADLHELMSEKFLGVDGKFLAVEAQRIAFSLLTAEQFNRVEALIQDMAILRDEKFINVHQLFLGVDQRFIERDVRADKLAEAGGLALQAALQAAEKAVGKNELVTGKLLETQASQLQTETAGLRSQLADAKERLTRIEGAAIGKIETKGEQHTSSAFIVSVIGIGLALMSAIITVVLFSLRR